MQKISTVALSVQKLGWGGNFYPPPPPIRLAYIKKPIPNRVNKSSQTCVPNIKSVGQVAHKQKTFSYGAVKILQNDENRSSTKKVKNRIQMEFPIFFS